MREACSLRQREDGRIAVVTHGEVQARRLRLLGFDRLQVDRISEAEVVPEIGDRGLHEQVGVDRGRRREELERGVVAEDSLEDATAPRLDVRAEVRHRRLDLVGGDVPLGFEQVRPFGWGDRGVVGRRPG